MNNLDCANSAWVYVGTKVYDITPWLSGHPGGKEVLLLSAGRYVFVFDIAINLHSAIIVFVAFAAPQ
jgi:hypothetical protein